MKIALFAALFLITGSAFAGTTVNQMTCAQAQAFGASHRYLDYNYGGTSVERVYFFPISQCAGSEFLVRLPTRDNRACPVGCEPNPGSGN